MKKELFRGCSTALVTPFTNDFKVCYATLGKLIDRQLDAGIKCLTILGTTSEYSTLKEAEMLEMVKFIVKRVNKRAFILCGTGRNDTLACLDFSKEVQKLGIDAFLIVTPYYNRTNEEGLKRHFQFLADNLNLPIILYNVPSRTGMTIPLSVYQVLKEHPLIYGTKEASGNLELLKEIKKSCGEDFYIYSGNDDQIVDVVNLGGSGVISVLSNVLPKETNDFTNLALEKKLTEANVLQKKYLKLIDNLFSETSPIPVKFLLSYLGLCQNILRMPLAPLSKHLEKSLIESWEELK